MRLLSWLWHIWIGAYGPVILAAFLVLLGSVAFLLSDVGL